MDIVNLCCWDQIGSEGESEECGRDIEMQIGMFFDVVVEISRRQR